MKYLFKLATIMIAAILLSGCFATAAKITIRDDVDTSQSNILVFPLLKNDGDFRKANGKFGNEMLDGLLLSDWNNKIASGTVITIPRGVISKIPNGWETMGELIKSLDNLSASEQLAGNTKIVEFVQEVSKSIGDGAMAFALVFEDEEQYKQTKALHGNMGLFDTKTLTWKWITKFEKVHAIPVPYQVAVQELFDSSWEALKEKNNGKVR